MTAATTDRISSTTKKLRPGSQKLGKNDGKYEVRPRFALDRLPPWQCFAVLATHAAPCWSSPSMPADSHVQATAAEPVPC